MRGGKSYDSRTRNLACHPSLSLSRPPLSLFLSLARSPYRSSLSFVASPANPRSSPARFTLGYRAVPSRL